jgi:hypothetical protein
MDIAQGPIFLIDFLDLNDELSILREPLLPGSQVSK